MVSFSLHFSFFITLICLSTCEFETSKRPPKRNATFTSSPSLYFLNYKPQDFTSLGACSESHKGFEICSQLVATYVITPFNLTKNILKILSQPDLELWTANSCMYQLAKRLICHKKPINCTNYFHSPRRNDTTQYPIVAIVAATTTRNISNIQFTNLPLFSLLFPSLAHTLQCGYHYAFILGFDDDDNFYSLPENQQAVHEWFNSYLQSPLLLNYHINITLHLIPVHNQIMKPGPVFQVITSYAYSHSAEYIYRINDDTEFKTIWVKKYIEQLSLLSYPYGVVGPYEYGVKNRILTHDFVHRTHLDIFQPNYYPLELSDWWMDDWMSRIYGKKRTYLLKSVQVKHHCYHQKMRYQVNTSRVSILPIVIQDGKRRLYSYMKGYYENYDDVMNNNRSDLMDLKRLKEFEVTADDQLIIPLRPYLTIVEENIKEK